MKFLLADCETTGFKVERDRILSLSYLILSSNLTVEKAKHAFIYIPNMSIPKESTEVHHLTTELLATCGRESNEVYDEFYADFQRCNFLAHNADFDERFIREEFFKAGYTMEFNNKFCTMRATTELCAIQKGRGEGFKWPKLHEACDYFHVTDDMVKRIYDKHFSDFKIPLNLQFHSSAYDVCATYVMLLMGGWACVQRYYDFNRA